MTITQIINSFRRYLQTQYSNNYPPQSMIYQQRYKIKNLTIAPTSYFDLIRILSRHLNVRVMYNKSSILEGIYIIGREPNAVKFMGVLKNIIDFVETDVLQFGYKRYISKKPKEFHGHEEIAKFRSKKINIFANEFIKMEKDYSTYAKIKAVLEWEKADQVFFNEFIKSFPNLKIKTSLRWK